VNDECQTSQVHDRLAVNSSQTSQVHDRLAVNSSNSSGREVTCLSGYMLVSVLYSGLFVMQLYSCLFVSSDVISQQLLLLQQFNHIQHSSV